MRGEEWQNLVALADIEGPAGRDGENRENGKTPEFRVNENKLEWRYIGDTVWLNLYDLSALKGADGINGADGRDGADGKTPFWAKTAIGGSVPPIPVLRPRAQTVQTALTAQTADKLKFKNRPVYSMAL